MSKQQLGRRAARLAKAAQRAKAAGDDRSYEHLARRATIRYRAYLVA